MSVSDNRAPRAQHRPRTGGAAPYPRVFIVQIEKGGRIRFQGDEEVIAEFLARCRARGLTLRLLYLSYCG